MKIPLTLALALLAWVDTPAFASKNKGVDILQNRPESRDSTAQTVKMNGNLACDSGRVAARLGLPCTLMIEDLKTGKIYSIETESADQSQLLELYEAGHRNVAIEGNLTDSNTIRVRQAKSL